MLVKAWPRSSDEGKPRMVAWPVVGARMFMSILRRVVFPAPFAPTSAKTEPAAMRSETSRSAVSRPKDLVSAVVAIAGSMKDSRRTIICAQEV